MMWLFVTVSSIFEPLILGKHKMCGVDNACMQKEQEKNNLLLNNS